MDDQAAELRKNTLSKSVSPRIPGRLRCIAIGSGKGGVGKTMISIGLATTLARMHYRVLLLDADLGLANVDLQMGFDPTFTLQDVIFGNCSLPDAIVHIGEGLSVLAASSGAQEMVDMGNARRQVFVEELMRFAGSYDYLIIDAAAGIGREVTTFLSATPEVLVVVANEPTSVMDAYSLIKVLRQHEHPPEIMMIVNSVRSIEEGELLAARLNTITKKFLNYAVPMAGVVIYDPVVGDAIRARRPVVHYAPKSAPAHCLSDLAKCVAGRESRMRVKGRLDKPLFDKIADIGLKTEQA